MRAATGLTDDLITGGLEWVPVVDSYLGGKWLARVPVAAGSVSWSTGRDVQGSLDLTVPRRTVERDWRPGNDVSHPLARFGQTLHVSVKVTSLVSRRSWTVRLGTFLVARTEPSAGDVRVTGVSMFQRLVDDKIVMPTAPRSGGTLTSELRRLLPASIGLTVSGVSNRACPAMSWGESRMDAVRDVADAWPARLRETAAGDARVLAPLPDVPVPVLSLTDGASGTVVDAYPDDQRDGVYNRVVARGTETTDSGAPTVQAVAEVMSGPLSTRGPYGAVTMFHASPLHTSWSIAMASAKTTLSRVMRAARTVPVTCASDPRVEMDDAVSVTADGVTWWGYVSGVTTPLTAEDGDMRLDVEVA